MFLGVVSVWMSLNVIFRRWVVMSKFSRSRVLVLWFVFYCRWCWLFSTVCLYVLWMKFLFCRWMLLWNYCNFVKSIFIYWSVVSGCWKCGVNICLSSNCGKCLMSWVWKLKLFRELWWFYKVVVVVMFCWWIN